MQLFNRSTIVATHGYTHEHNLASPLKNDGLLASLLLSIILIFIK